MKKDKLRYEILLTSFISLFLLQAFSISAVTLVCTPCQIGNCNCNVAACPSGSGLLSIYKTSDCYGVPVFKIPFTANAAVWSPDSFGVYYGKALCDDRLTKSDCSIINVMQTTTTTFTEITTETTETETTETGTPTETETIPPSGGGSNLGLWLGMIFIIVIIIVAIYFLVFKGKKQKSSSKVSYEDLYRKWSR